MRSYYLKKLLLLSTTLLVGAQAQAYYSTMTTGDLLETGEFSANAETQFITDNNSGVNIIGRFDSWLTSDSNFRTVVGFGTTDFQVGGYYKWVPFPDVADQPAIGLMAGVNYARFDGENDLSLRAHPFLSKRFELEIGDLTPYVALPFGIRSMAGDTDVPVQFNLGAEFKTFHFEKITFLAEIGFDVNDAFTYLSLSASVRFDEEGIEFR